MHTTSDIDTRTGPAPPDDCHKRCCKVGVSSNRAGTVVSFTVRGVTVPPADTFEAPGDFLAPEPAVRTGALIGYAR